VEKAGEVNATKAYKQNYGDFLLNYQWVLHLNPLKKALQNFKEVLNNKPIHMNMI
jgi:hypothetical protein